MARGIERRDIFRSDTDRKDFLERMAQAIEVSGARLFDWSLPYNHFHLLLRGSRLSSRNRESATRWS